MNIVAIPAAAPANPEPEGRAENRAGESLVAQSTLDTTPPIVCVPVDGRGVALAIVATVVLIFALEWAQTFFVSLLLGILFAYTLNPLVVWLEFIKIPRVLGTGIVLAAVVCALVLGSYSLRGQMERIVEQLPAATSKFSAGLASIRGDHLGNMQKVETAAREIEKAASQGADSSSTPKQPATHVVIDHPSFKLGNFLWVGSMGAVGVIGEAVMVLFLVFFLLLGGDTFKRKLVRITGPSLSNKKITVHILDDINDSIQKYMFMLLITNVLVGLLSWIAFRWIGLETRERGQSRLACFISSLTWVRALPQPPPEWRRSFSSTCFRWLFWSPGRR